LRCRLRTEGRSRGERGEDGVGGDSVAARLGLCAIPTRRGDKAEGKDSGGGGAGAQSEDDRALPAPVAPWVATLNAEPSALEGPESSTDWLNLCRACSNVSISCRTPCGCSVSVFAVLPAAKET
jgi:hypothetical protein